MAAPYTLPKGQPGARESPPPAPAAAAKRKKNPPLHPSAKYSPARQSSPKLLTSYPEAEIQLVIHPANALPAKSRTMSSPGGQGPLEIRAPSPPSLPPSRPLRICPPSTPQRNYPERHLVDSQEGGGPRASCRRTRDP